MKRLLVWITNTKVWSYLLIKIVPYIRFTTYYTDFKGLQFTVGYKHLQAGDIILTKDKQKLTTVLIGGEFTHAAFCLRRGLPYEIAEMTHNHYTRSYFFDICKESDRVVILRCKDFDADYINKMIETCESFKDCKYDLAFDLGVKALYCSELVYQADFERRLKVDLSDLVGLGRQYVSPTDLFEADNIEVVFDSDKLVT
jgi:hypothetical protein